MANIDIPGKTRIDSHEFGVLQRPQTELPFLFRSEVRKARLPSAPLKVARQTFQFRKSPATWLQKATQCFEFRAEFSDTTRLFQGLCEELLPFSEDSAKIAHLAVVLKNGTLSLYPAMRKVRWKKQDAQELSLGRGIPNKLAAVLKIEN